MYIDTLFILAIGFLCSFLLLFAQVLLLQISKFSEAFKLREKFGKNIKL